MDTTMDQAVAQLQHNLNDAIAGHRTELAHRREHFGDKFDNTRVVVELASRLDRGLPKDARTVLLAAALNRLAQMDDFVPAPEVAELDFDFNFDPEGDEP